MKLLKRVFSPLTPILLSITFLSLIGCATSSSIQQSDANGQSAVAMRDRQALAAEFQQWRALARNGDDQAQFRVGKLYDQGKGVSRDPRKAIDWFRSAAAQGNPDAQFYLGLMYAKGRATEKDDAVAAQWFEKAAEQGYARAQYRLGLAYANAVGVPKDAGKGLYWLRKAADQGDTSAQHCLGLRYAKGDGVEQDAEQAAEWIYRAGVGFIADGRVGAARLALYDIENQTPGHALVTQLRAHLSFSESVPSDKAPRLDLLGASVGTAWPIASGYVVTNNHVVGKGDRVTLINTSGEKIAATVVERDREHDLALLSVEDTHWLPLALPLARQRVYEDANVFTVGFPRIDQRGETPKVSAGRVSAVNGLHDDPSSYQLSLTIQQGNSGGPLINTNGEVVGVIASMLGAVDAQGNIQPIPSVSFAVKVRHLRDMLSFLPIQDATLGELPHYTDTIEELADRIEHSVLIVVAR
jgi:S1-C subfamily serine protease